MESRGSFGTAEDVLLSSRPHLGGPVEFHTELGGFRSTPDCSISYIGEIFMHPIQVPKMKQTKKSTTPLFECPCSLSLQVLLVVFQHQLAAGRRRQAGRRRLLRLTSLGAGLSTRRSRSRRARFDPLSQAAGRAGRDGVGGRADRR